MAKLHKIWERKEDPDRREDKDALDVLRLLRASDADRLAATLTGLGTDAVAGDVTCAARTFLDELFAGRDKTGSRMAVRASAGLEDGAAIAVSCELLARDVLRSWR